MFKFLLFIYVLGVILFAVTFIAFVIIGTKQFCRKHPGVTLPKTHSYVGYVKFAAVTFCPLVHYLFLAVLIFAWDEVMEKTLENIEADIDEDKYEQV